MFFNFPIVGYRGVFIAGFGGGLCWRQKFIGFQTEKLVVTYVSLSHPQAEDLIIYQTSLVNGFF